MGDLNLSQFVDETVIDELEREGFFRSLEKEVKSPKQCH